MLYDFSFILISSISISYILYGINKTDFLEEYLSLIYKYFNINILWIKDYNDSLKPSSIINTEFISYKEFLINQKNNFFIRLLFCCFCLSFSLSLFTCILFNKFYFPLLISYLSCVFYIELERLIKLKNKN
jgi:hypothetical protein